MFRDHSGLEDREPPVRDSLLQESIHMLHHCEPAWRCGAVSPNQPRRSFSLQHHYILCFQVNQISHRPCQYHGRVSTFVVTGTMCAMWYNAASTTLRDVGNTVTRSTLHATICVLNAVLKDYCSCPWSISYGYHTCLSTHLEF